MKKVALPKEGYFLPGTSIPVTGISTHQSAINQAKQTNGEAIAKAPQLWREHEIAELIKLYQPALQSSYQLHAPECSAPLLVAYAMYSSAYDPAPKAFGIANIHASAIRDTSAKRFVLERLQIQQPILPQPTPPGESTDPQRHARWKEAASAIRAANTRYEMDLVRWKLQQPRILQCPAALRLAIHSWMLVTEPQNWDKIVDHVPNSEENKLDKQVLRILRNIAKEEFID